MAQNTRSAANHWCFVSALSDILWSRRWWGSLMGEADEGWGVVRGRWGRGSTWTFLLKQQLVVEAVHSKNVLQVSDRNYKQQLNNAQYKQYTCPEEYKYLILFYTHTSTQNKMCVSIERNQILILQPTKQSTWYICTQEIKHSKNIRQKTLSEAHFIFYLTTVFY